jgi:hypothetical protein
VPSWGASTVGSAGGGTAPCTIRVAYSNVDKDTGSDKEIALALPQNGTASGSPAPSTPESPLAIALPAGAVALFGGAGVILFRKRRHAAA